MAVAAGECEDKVATAKSPFGFVCNQNKANYIVPLIIIIIFCIVAGVLALLLRSSLAEDDEADDEGKTRNNYY